MTAVANAIPSAARGAFKAISPRSLKVQESEGQGGQCYKTVICWMPEHVTFNDLNSHPEMWSMIQESPFALNEHDKLELRWGAGMVVYAAVDYTEGGEVHLFDIRKPTRRKSVGIAWTDGKYIVRPVDGAWAYFRIAGDGGDDLRLGSGTWPTWEGAKQACIANEYPRKIR
jgi:hypothetical protein